METMTPITIKGISDKIREIGLEIGEMNGEKEVKIISPLIIRPI